MAKRFEVLLEKTFCLFIKTLNASLLIGNAFVFEAEIMRFNSRAGQIGHSVVDGSPPLQHIFKKAVLSAMMRNGPCKLISRFGTIQGV